MWTEGARPAWSEVEEKSTLGFMFARASWGAAVLRPYMIVLLRGDDGRATYVRGLAATSRIR